MVCQISMLRNMSVLCCCAANVMDLSGVFHVANSDFLQEVILWACTHVTYGSPTTLFRTLVRFNCQVDWSDLTSLQQLSKWETKVASLQLLFLMSLPLAVNRCWTNDIPRVQIDELSSSQLTVFALLFTISFAAR